MFTFRTKIEKSSDPWTHFIFGKNTAGKVPWEKCGRKSGRIERFFDRKKTLMSLILF